MLTQVAPMETEIPTKYYKTNGKPENGIKAKNMIEYDRARKVVESGKAITEIKDPDDLFQNLKFFLIVGRFIGIIPYSGVFGKSYTQLYFRPKSVAAIASIVILIVLSVNLILGALESIRMPKRNALEIANSVRATVQFLWAWLIYVYFLVRGKKFIELFHYWADTKVYYGVKDRHLKRDVILITLTVLMSAVLENAVLSLEYISALDDFSGWRFSNSTTRGNFLETYYRRSHNHWSTFLEFHEVFAVVAFIQHKCVLYGFNYVDIMIAVFARAIYFRFQMLYELTYEQLAKPLRKGGVTDSHSWTLLAFDHKRLCDLLQEMENFFSPLIFVSYGVNIFYICVQLLDGLTMDISTRSLVHSVYAPWSFMHIIFRALLLSICAARINSYAHEIQTVIQECPTDQYNVEVARLDKKVTTGPEIGFTGLGCFVVTKPFILKIISVVFTFEIVLLQGATSSQPR